MKTRQYAFFGGALLAAIVITIGGWHPLANADSSSRPVFAVDASWPNPLPAPVGTDGVALRLGAGRGRRQLHRHAR
jgi:hypothetical protein